MKRLILATVMMVAFVWTTQSGFAQEKRGPSTPEERANVVRITRELENDPLNKRAMDGRALLVKWIDDVPDISVVTCTSFMLPLLDKKNKNYSAELVVQQMFSSAAFIIENPDKAKDDQAVYLAGVEGVLRTYESILKVKPKAKQEFLDGLIEKRGKGELGNYVYEFMKTECKRG